MTTADDERRAEDERWEERGRIAHRDGYLPIGPAPAEVQEAIVRMLRKAHAEERSRQQARDQAVLAEANQRHVRETLAARQPEFARTVDCAAREASPRTRRTR